MMKKILKNIQLAAALAAVGFVACDATPPPDTAISEAVEPETAADSAASPAAAVPEPVESEATAAARVALTDIGRDDDAFSRARRFATLLPTLGPEAIPVVQEMFKDPMFTYFGATDFDLLVRYWATHQPADAAQWALRAPQIPRVAATYTAFNVWAESDPMAAMEATRSTAAMAGEARDVVQYALVRGWYKKDPEQLAQHIRGLEIGVSRQRALSVYVQEVIRGQGTDAVMRWAEALPDDAKIFKQIVYTQVGAALALFDHAAVMRWCDAHCGGPFGTNLQNIIGRRWAMTDGPAALAWLSTAPDGYDKDLAVRGAYGVFARTDPAAAIAWMFDQTPEKLDDWRRPLLVGYVKLIGADSPAEAIEWAELIEADDARELWLTRVARFWYRVDEDAAEAWLLQSELSEEAREKVRASAE